MEWNYGNFPNETRRYLVSVMLQRPKGAEVFKYIAHFDSESKKWFKYDPFTEKQGEEVEGEIIAWGSEVAIALP